MSIYPARTTRLLVILPEFHKLSYTSVSTCNCVWQFAQGPLQRDVVKVSTKIILWTIRLIKVGMRDSCHYHDLLPGGHLSSDFDGGLHWEASVLISFIDVLVDRCDGQVAVYIRNAAIIEDVRQVGIRLGLLNRMECARDVIADIGESSHLLLHELSPERASATGVWLVGALHAGVKINIAEGVSPIRRSKRIITIARREYIIVSLKLIRLKDSLEKSRRTQNLRSEDVRCLFLRYLNPQELRQVLADLPVALLERNKRLYVALLYQQCWLALGKLHMASSLNHNHWIIFNG